MNCPSYSHLGRILLITSFSISAVLFVPAQQKMDRIERERMKDMLKNVVKTIKTEYYDPEYKGINLDERLKQAEARLEQVTNTGQSMAVIAQVLMDFNDSHLFFLPPATNLKVEYGWRQTVYGSKSFITMVKPKSDAEAKGLKVGDQLISVEGFRPARKEMWKMNYYYNVLSKRPSLKLTVLSPGESQPRDIEIASKVTKLPKLLDQKTFYQLFDTDGKSSIEYNYFKTVGNVTIWKMPTFGIDPSNVDVLMGKVRNSPNLILDLRGNGGGFVVTLERLASFLFDRDLRIAELKGRKKMDPQESKTKGSEVYKGNLIVLIDSESGSAAEIFARLVQLEKRGIVMGDTSAGAVMQSRQIPISMGGNDEIVYGVSVTNADVIMSDGKSLEHVGVTPDEVVLPTGEDLAAYRDPVLSKAINSFGGVVSSDDAGKIFRYKWTEGANGTERIEIVVN